MAAFISDIYYLALNPYHEVIFPKILAERKEDRPILEPYLNLLNREKEIAVEKALDKYRKFIAEQEAIKRQEQIKILFAVGASVFLFLAGIGLFFGFISSLPEVNPPGSEDPEGSQKNFLVVTQNTNIYNSSNEVILTVPPNFKTSVIYIDRSSMWIEIDMSPHHDYYETGWIYYDESAMFIEQF